MGKYRVEVNGSEITGCVQIKINERRHDYLLLKQFGSFAHIDHNTMTVSAYLVKAQSPTDAKIKVLDKLKN